MIPIGRGQRELIIGRPPDGEKTARHSGHDHQPEKANDMICIYWRDRAKNAPTIAQVIKWRLTDAGPAMEYTNHRGVFGSGAGFACNTSRRTRLCADGAEYFRDKQAPTR